MNSVLTRVDGRLEAFKYQRSHENFMPGNGRFDS